jgi:hypothetical protein
VYCFIIPMKLYGIFFGIVACYGLICSGITLLCIFSNANFDDLVSYVSSFDNRHNIELRDWHLALSTDFNSCSGTMDCTSGIALHILNLFYLFTYVPICAMFVAFVLDNPMIKNTLYGESLGVIFTGGREVSLAEMPPLENASSGRGQGPLPSTTPNRPRSSSESSNEAKQTGHQLIYDDTFGIIQKEILDIWNRPKKMHIDTDELAPPPRVGTPLPPIRNITPRPSSSAPKKINN